MGEKLISIVANGVRKDIPQKDFMKLCEATQDGSLQREIKTKIDEMEKGGPGSGRHPEGGASGESKIKYIPGSIHDPKVGIGESITFKPRYMKDRLKSRQVPKHLTGGATVDSNIKADKDLGKE
jgi:hypothetical protein